MQNNVIGRNITIMLEKMGETQQWLAKSLGVSQSAVSDWVNGKKVPRRATLEKIAQVLDAPPEDFFVEPLTTSPQKNILRQRIAKGLSIKDLADKMNVDEEIIQQWESGERFTDIKTLEKISEALCVNVVDLLGQPMGNPVELYGFMSIEYTKQLVDDHREWLDSIPNTEDFESSNNYLNSEIEKLKEMDYKKLPAGGTFLNTYDIYWYENLISYKYLTTSNLDKSIVINVAAEWKNLCKDIALKTYFELQKNQLMLNSQLTDSSISVNTKVLNALINTYKE